MTRPLIAVCVPVPSASKATLSANWVLSMMMMWYATSRLYDIEIFFDSAMGFGYSRTRLTEKALTPHEGRSADYIFWLDSDVELPPDTILRMMRHNKRIVSAMYWSKRLEEFPIVYDWDENDRAKPIEEIPKKMFRAGAVGMGACLVQATVYASLVMNIPEDAMVHRDRPWKVTGKDGKVRYNFYAQNEDDEGHLLGEDVYFCKLVREWTKAQIWVDPSIDTRHTGEAEAHWREGEMERVMI